MNPYGGKLLLFLVLITALLGTMNADDDCIIKNSTVVCVSSIPLVLPANVTHVVIKDYLQQTISNETFMHGGWSFVASLDVYVTDEVRFHLLNRNFPLPNLQILGIHSPSLRFSNISASVLEGLPKLHKLNLSLCHNLKATDVMTMLITLHHLDTLILDQLAISGTRFLYFDDAFIEMLRDKNVRKLSLSGCNLYVKGPFHVKYPLTSLVDFDISNTTIVFTDSEYITNLITVELLPNLRILDLSFLQNRFLSLNLEFLQNVITPDACLRNNGFINLLLRLEYIKLHNILSGTLRGYDTIIDFSMCKTNIKSLDISSNNLNYLNITILWPSNSSSFEIDLSSNGLEYLSPSLLGSVTSLEIIKLSDNRLHLMEHLKEFKDLFTEHKHLKHLDLSKNLLTSLPFRIFCNNIDLITLDLSYNKLTSIGFSLNHLLNLQFLNLKTNAFSIIDSSGLNGLQKLLSHTDVHLTIHLQNNPFICTCEAVSFLKWLRIYSKNTFKERQTCSFNGRDNVVINEYVINDISFSCMRTKIIIASITTVLGTIIFIVIAVLFVSYKKKQRNRKRKRGNFLKDFKLGKLTEKYLCFVSYSSDDDDTHMREINACITESLQEIIKTEKEVLCDNSEHFNLGFPIIDEIMRCIGESCVGIFFVTSNFCQSHWCQMELRETYDLNKPIILIFKENIDERNMSPLMFKIFRKFTRAKIIINGEGQFQMIPDAKQISNSIIKLASLKYDETVENNKFLSRSNKEDNNV